jgi:hypothetical protein
MDVKLTSSPSKAVAGHYDPLRTAACFPRGERVHRWAFAPTALLNVPYCSRCSRSCREWCSRCSAAARRCGAVQEAQSMKTLVLIPNLVPLLFFGRITN